MLLLRLHVNKAPFNAVSERDRGKEITVHEQKDGMAQKRERNSKVITDIYGQEMRKEKEFSNILIHRLAGSRIYGFSVAPAGDWLDFKGVKHTQLRERWLAGRLLAPLGL